jgi:hypothetical protein
MRTNTKILIEKIHALSPEQIAEVDDFVEFLRLKEQQHLLRNLAAKISEPVFTKLWDNSDDEAYDAIS